MTRYKADDISLLVPAFRERVEELLASMTRLGFDPIVRDGFRTQEEAKANAAKGVGIADSMHCYGIAADIISGSRGWLHPTFFAALGHQAKAFDLVWGGDWPRRDLPHVQAVPLRLQAAIRKMPRNQIDGFLRVHWGEWSGH